MFEIKQQNNSYNLEKKFSKKDFPSFALAPPPPLPLSIDNRHKRECSAVDCAVQPNATPNLRPTKCKLYINPIDLLRMFFLEM